MNGIHDMGGMHGLGPIDREENEPVFHHAWERRAVARNINSTGHTRLPRYARGKRGVVDRDYGVFVFADASAMGRGKQPQHLYSVRFAARELWGPEASARDVVFIDLWDDHLDPA